MKNYIQNLPKAELHLHIEGTLEPELLLKLAERNAVTVPYQTVEEARRAYNFSNLQSFLDVYYAACSVLHTEQDFYDLTLAYLTKAHSHNIRHVEIFFDPQTHTERGISFGTVISGISQALSEGEKTLGISSVLILCFLRHLSADAAFQTLHTALPYKHLFGGVGLDSAEKDNPPHKFVDVFKEALEHGLFTVAHAGEEGPPLYIWEALDLLKVSRIDHGVHCSQDDQLIARLVREQIPLTMCPLSNLKLCVIKDLKDHPLKLLLNKGLCVTINSDDPAYFGGYINENYLAVAEALSLTRADVHQLAKNSFIASVLPLERKTQLIAELLTA